MTTPVTAAVMLALLSTVPTFAETPRELFIELRDAGGVHPLAQLVCLPAPGQDQDTTFTLVAFSRDFAKTLRSKGKPVPKEFLAAEKDQEKDEFIMQWVFRNGVRVHNDPEVLGVVADSHRTMWSADYPVPKAKQTKFTLRMVFSLTGRYSRDVLVDGRVTTSVYGRCEPVD